MNLCKICGRPLLTEQEKDREKCASCFLFGYMSHEDLYGDLEEWEDE